MEKQAEYQTQQAPIEIKPDGRYVTSGAALGELPQSNIMRSLTALFMIQVEPLLGEGNAGLPPDRLPV